MGYFCNESLQAVISSTVELLASSVLLAEMQSLSVIYANYKHNLVYLWAI